MLWYIRSQPVVPNGQCFCLLVCVFVCLFVCLEFFVHPENVLLIWRRHHCWWRAVNFDLYWALITIEQRGLFNVSHLLWHGIIVIFIMVISENPWYSHLMLRVWQWRCHYMFIDLGLGFEHPTFLLLTYCAIAATPLFWTRFEIYGNLTK